MSTNAGIPRRFAIGSPLTDFDPSGGWTVVQSRDKKEEGETTRKATYFKSTPIAGKLTGQVALRADQDNSILLNAEDTPFFLEDALGRAFSGNVTYVADGEENLEDGTVQVELSGTVELQ